MSSTRGIDSERDPRPRLPLMQRRFHRGHPSRRSSSVATSRVWTWVSRTMTTVFGRTRTRFVVRFGVSLQCNPPMICWQCLGRGSDAFTFPFQGSMHLGSPWVSAANLLCSKTAFLLVEITPGISGHSGSRGPGDRQLGRESAENRGVAGKNVGDCGKGKGE